MNLEDFKRKTMEIKQLLDPKRVERKKKEEKKKAMTTGLAVGAFLGGLAGIFFAPDKGENTRKKTKEELDKIKENLQTSVTEGKEKFEVNLVEGKEKLSEIYEDKKDVFTEKISAFKEKVKSSPQLSVVQEDELEIEKEELAKEEA